MFNSERRIDRARQILKAGIREADIIHRGQDRLIRGYATPADPEFLADKLISTVQAMCEAVNALDEEDGNG